MTEHEKQQVERIKGVVHRDEYFRNEGTQASTIEPLFKIIDRLDKQLLATLALLERVLIDIDEFGVVELDEVANNIKTLLRKAKEE